MNILFELGGHRYAVLEALGEGGAATVHRCWDRELNVERAIKLRRVVDHPRQQEGIQRLQDEARVMAKLTHDNVLPVYDVGLENGWQWVVMELAGGGSLKDQLAQGPLSPKDAIAKVIALLDGLQTAHDLGVIHRDIKPHNVLIGDDGRAMLADWGIARLDERAMTLTSTGVAMGSMSYMAPEQRLDAHQVDETADVYGMGALLYNIITRASPVDLFLARDNSPRWDDVPTELREPLRKACSKRREERYQSASEFAAALRLILPHASAVPITPTAPSDHGDTFQPSEIDRTVDPSAPPIVDPPRWPYWVAAVVAVLAVASLGTLLIPGVMPQAQTIVLPAIPQPQPVEDVGTLAPEPEPVPTPAPAPAPAASSAPIADDPTPPNRVVEVVPELPPPTQIEGPTLPVHGAWRGSLEGQLARLRLGGAPTALAGTLTVGDERAAVTGRYSSATQSLILTVKGSYSSSGKWSLTYGKDRLRGSAQLTQSGDLIPVSFVRVPIR